MPLEDTIARLRDRMSHTVTVVPDPERDYERGVDSLPTRDLEAIPIDSAGARARSLMPAGPRGRDDSGQPVAVPPGVPPVEAPGGWGAIRPGIPKELRVPEQPGNVERYLDVLTPGTVTAGQRLLDRTAGFPVRAIQIDNHSALWLYLPSAGRYVPPFCVFVQMPVHLASNKIEVLASAPPGFTQGTAAATQAFSILGFERELDFSPGFSIPTGQHP